MQVVQRYDPSASGQPQAGQDEPTLSLADQIALRRNKRKLAALEGSTAAAPVAPTSRPSPAAPPAPAPATREQEAVGPTGWVPAAGETPAEREKRMKKEKRAAKLGLPPPAAAAAWAPTPPVASTSTSTSIAGEWQPKGETESPAEREKRLKREKRMARFGGELPSSSYAPPPVAAASNAYEQRDEAGAEQDGPRSTLAIHPSRLAAPALARAVEKESKPPKEKTAAKKRYLKKKAQRAKGAKAASSGKKAGGATVGDREEGSDSGSDSDDAEDGEEPTEQEKEAKRLLIAQKKEARRVARLAKKAELRRLREAGLPLPASAPAPVAAVAAAAVSPVKTTIKPTATVVVRPEKEQEAVKKTKEEEEEEAERERKREVKRRKREDRKLLPSAAVDAASEVAEEAIETSAAVEDAMEEETPGLDPKSLPPLLRLPRSSRPAPPPAAVLEELMVHASVRGKVVLQRGTKVKVAEVKEVDEKSRMVLGKMGIDELFSVQTAVIPLLVRASRSLAFLPSSALRDLCVSAPTGSGKTLSYALPIAQSLRLRVVPRLRALVLLPTRELVGQVKETFEGLLKGTGVRVGSATGQGSFTAECLLFGGSDGQDEVDILLATPGRLIDHLHSPASRLSLKNLRWLVVDEADRLLGQSYHDWLPEVLGALPGAVSEGEEQQLGGTDIPAGETQRCQKLLFSATLSRDAATIASLKLNRPVYVSVEDGGEGGEMEGRFTFPETLTERMIISPSTHKPLLLFHLLQTVGISSALCFTKSLESASRLSKLVELFHHELLVSNPAAKSVVVRSYSSDQPARERQATLAAFKKGEVHMLVCSDLISRGIDLPGVSHVISYDIPATVERYVHRVGRTARAGAEGEAWNLVEEQEVSPFRALMKGAQHWEAIERVKVAEKKLEEWVGPYERALKGMLEFFAPSKADGMEVDV